jgi:5'-AMP-activated protein kinase regulatory beta subunit
MIGGNSQSTATMDGNSVGGHAQPNITAGLHDSGNVPLVKTKFTWKHGGTNVFLTGSFNQWLAKIPMRPVADRPMEFETTLEIPVGKHHFKFIVDDRWKFAPELPSEMDSDFKVSNVIEVTASQPIPGPEEFTVPPPPIPPHYLVNILQPLPGREHDPLQALNPRDRVPDLDPVVLPRPDHVAVNHIMIAKRVAQDSKPGEDSDEPVVMGLTQRYKNKFVTTVYYRPKPSITV